MVRTHAGAEGAERAVRKVLPSFPITSADASRLLAVWKPVIFDAVFLSLSTSLVHLLCEPLWGCDGSPIPRRLEGFPHRLDAVTGANLGQPMGCVTALASARFDVASFPKPCQQQINDPQFLMPSEQAVPKRDEHPVIETRIIAFQPQHILPI
jgi:hypothetical protein